MQPRKILSLSKPLSLETLIKIKVKRSPQEIAQAKARDKQRKVLRIKNTLQWLYSHYPDCFNRLKPKPLKLGIEQDIFKDLARITATYAIDPQSQSTTSFVPSKKSLRDTVSYYAHSIKYLKAQLSHSCRINLQGQAMIHQPVTQTQQDYALRRLDLIKANTLKRQLQSHTQALHTISHMNKYRPGAANPLADKVSDKSPADRDQVDTVVHCATLD